MLTDGEEEEEEEERQVMKEGNKIEETQKGIISKNEIKNEKTEKCEPVGVCDIAAVHLVKDG